MTIAALLTAAGNARCPYTAQALRKHADALMISQPDRLEIEERPPVIAAAPVYAPVFDPQSRQLPLFVWILAAAALIACLPPFWS